MQQRTRCSGERDDFGIRGHDGTTGGAKAVNEVVDSAKVIRRSPALDAVLAPDVKIERVATGFVFTEGPMWHNGALWFSDLMGNRMYSLSADGTLQALAGSRGRSRQLPGRGLWRLERHGHRSRRHRADDAASAAADRPRSTTSWVITPFLTAYDGKQFNSPNDLVFSPDGALYFTDPPYRVVQPGDAQRRSGQGSAPRRSPSMACIGYTDGNVDGRHHGSAGDPMD